MSLLQRIFHGPNPRQALEPLYRAVVAAGRHPGWYRNGQVPDTLDGRFDMIAAILALVLLRLEREGDSAREESVLLTELFIDDMDATLRQIGIGDYVVGKHVGRMMSALGGRLTALRDARDSGGFEPAVRRNIFHDSPPCEEALRWVARGMERYSRALDAAAADSLLEGRLPPP